MITQFKNNIALLHGDNSQELSWPRGAGFFIEDIMEIEAGHCHCGCGRLVPIAKQSHTVRGHIKGQPIRFIKGHHNYLKDYNGEKNPKWNGGITYDSVGRKFIYDVKHGTVCHYKYEYILIAEKALGRYLKRTEEIHHVDLNFKNNSNNNLVICQDSKYHKLLHLRTKAYKACGNANWRKCWICKKYDDPNNLTRNYHKNCLKVYNALRYKKNKIDMIKEA